MLVILLCNLVCVHIHKICEEKFGSSRLSFSWLGRKVKITINQAKKTTKTNYTVYLHNLKVTHLINYIPVSPLPLSAIE